MEERRDGFCRPGCLYSARPFPVEWECTSILSALCVDVAVDVSDFGRIAVRVVAAANGRMIGHAPRRVELLVQELILRRMVAKACMALPILRLGRRR